MENNRKRKNKKAYYCNRKKAKRLLTLDEGMKGFMLTCNNKEKQCIAEAYNVLNEFAETLYGPENREDTPVGETKEDSESDEDVSKELEKELEGIKTKKPLERRFQAVDTRANNCLFIKTQLNNPGELMQAILVDIEKTQKQRTRFLLRMIPVLHTCKAYAEVITKHSSTFVEDHNDMIAKHKSFAVNFKARNNATIGRLDVINTLAALIHAKNPTIKADLKNPEVVVNVDIIGPVCCLSVLPDYYRFKKYNLSEVASGNKKIKEDQKEDKREANEIKSEEAAADEIKSALPTSEDIPPPKADADTDAAVSPGTSEKPPACNSDSDRKESPKAGARIKNGETEKADVCEKEDDK